MSALSQAVLREGRSGVGPMPRPLRERHFMRCHSRSATHPERTRFRRLSFAYFSLARQRKVGAAPHRGNANRPKANQGKAKKTAQNKKTQITRAIADKTKDKIRVDIKGNEYSFPNTRRVISPGIRPMPIFLSQGQQLERIATAIKVVSSQRIMAMISKRVRPVAAGKRGNPVIDSARKSDHLEQLAHFGFGEQLLHSIRRRQKPHGV